MILRPQPSSKKARPWRRPTTYVPHAEARFASQHRTASGTTEISPRRARKAPSATAVSAGTGGKTFSSAESAISTR